MSRSKIAIEVGRTFLSVSLRSRDPRSISQRAISGLLLPIFCFSVLLLCCSSATAQVPASTDVARSIDHGIAYLCARSNEDGSIANGRRYPNATTSMAIMALTAVGHQPTDPTKEGKVLRDALRYMLDEDRITEEGYFGAEDNSRMYGHGITSLMLCEMLGMGINEQQDRVIRNRAERAIDLILKAQAVRKRSALFHGGWRYEPSSTDSDLSITVWQLMALRAGKAAGIDVPTRAIDDAVGYLERSYKRTGTGKGGFGYEPGQSPRYATTAAGLLAMQVCGRYEHEQVRGAVGFLKELGPKRGEQWFFYGSYYYAVGMDQAGKEEGDQAAERIWQTLSRMQRPDGGWAGASHETDPVYATSLAILALSVRYHYLPIYQR